MDNNEKLYPLKLNSNYFGECDEEQCAWYNIKTRKCAIRDIPDYLDWYKIVGIRGRC